VIETAIGGTPITMTVEGRNRFTVNVRYPQDLRSDIERLRQVLVPLPSAMPGGTPPRSSMEGDKGATRLESGQPALYLAQAMQDMSAAPGSPTPNGVPLPSMPTLSDAPRMDLGGSGSPGMPDPAQGARIDMGQGASGSGNTPAPRRTYIPLGELASIRIVGGPPMVRDEDGMLVGYVYVDIDQASRDIGGYVDDAKAVVQRALQAGALSLPPGYSLRWTGQYELLQETAARMKMVVPLTLMIVVLLLFLHFKNLIEVLIVLLSIPFALVGSVWLLWLLDYRMSTAVWVGIIALVGLAAQTGIVMILYIDHAFERRKRAGKIRDLNDIIWAHMEGTVLRVRPKLMTVSTMLIGLVPLLWASGSGADVMKRIAAPMVGGLITSAFLTLEIIPVIYTYWRQEQLLWELLPAHDAARLAKLKLLAVVHGIAWLALASLFVARVYVVVPDAWRIGTLAASVLTIVTSAAAYLSLRPLARRLVWPAPVVLGHHHHG
jgi:hypothetical protein